MQFARAGPGLVAIAFLLAGAALVADVPELEIGSGERLLVVAPHPDDETLGAGGLIQRVLARGGRVELVTLTAGDGFREALVAEGRPAPRPEEFLRYGEARIAELGSAVEVLGRGRVKLVLLGFPDGALDSVLREHRDRNDPVRSPTTGRTRPPYPEALDRHIHYDGSELRAQLRRILDAFDPTLVALPDPIDRHPDHAAAGIFTLIALAERAREREVSGRTAPRMLAYLIHWPDWPETPPSGLRPEELHALPLRLPDFLEPPERAATVLSLAPAEVDGKVSALARHRTQWEAMGSFLARFERRTEPFRVIDPETLDGVDALAAPRTTAKTVVPEEQRVD